MPDGADRVVRGRTYVVAGGVVLLVFVLIGALGAMKFGSDATIGEVHPVSVDPAPTSTAPLRKAWEGIDQQLRERAWGRVAVGAPATLGLHESSRVELVLSSRLGDAELIGMLKPADVVTSDRVQVSPVMEATLTSAAFSVREVSPRVQAVPPGGPAKWVWDVTASQAGKQALHLTLSGYVQVDGERTPVLTRELSREIRVTVSPHQQALEFLKDNWQFLAGSILIPLAVAAWARYRRKKSGSADAAAPG